MARKSLIMIILCSAAMAVSCGNGTGSVSADGKKDAFWYSGSRPFDVLNSILAERTMVTWSTGGHTAQPVPIGSIGPVRYTSRLSGMIPNTRIAEVLKQAVREKTNVILVIGDGMGAMHMSLPVYLRQYSSDKGVTFFEKIMNNGRSGLCLTNPWKLLVTDSAAAVTAIACGKKTRTGILGMDHNGVLLTSILDVAEKNGLSTGLITDTRITHATPAGFYANVRNRGSESAIADQLADNYDIEVLMGGGASFFVPSGTRVSEHIEFRDINPDLDSGSRREDGRDLIALMKKKGYSVVSSRNEMMRLGRNTGKILGLFSGTHMNSSIDRDDENTGEPSLVEMTDRALSLLRRNPSGFFMMVECGRLDHDAHDNDTGAVARAVSEMNMVLGSCYRHYISNSKKTLLVFTADHETGGLGLTYMKSKKILYRKKLSDGSEWKTRQNSMDKDGIAGVFRQKRSFRKIISMSGSAGEFRKLLKTSTGFIITEDEARRVYSMAVKNSKKHGKKHTHRAQPEKSR